MSSNGTTNSSSHAPNDPNGNQPNRFGRQSNRRGRGRGNQDRSNPSRGGYRRSNYREQNTRNNTQITTGMIDIEDSSQWPSIQESSNGSHARQRQNQQSNVQISGNSSGQVQSPVREDIEQNETRRMSNPRPIQYSNQNYGPRDYQRYQGTRLRGVPRYSQGRGYSNNYKRYNIRPGFTTIPAVYPNDPNFMNGQIYFSRGMPTPRTGNVMVSAQPQQMYQEVRRYEPRATGIVDPVRQVEYYFSVENLTTDLFIRAQMDCNGWVPINLIHTFRRISNLNLGLNEFVAKLETSDKLELDKEKLKVRTRTDPEKWYLPEDVSIVAKSNSVPTYKVDENELINNQFYDQYHQPVGYAAIPQYAPVQPMLIPIQGYQRPPRTRYVHQYSVYPPPGYSSINVYDGTSNENYYYGESENLSNSYYDYRGDRINYQDSTNYNDFQSGEVRGSNETRTNGDDTSGYYNQTNVENEDANVTSRNTDVESLTRHLSEVDLIDGPKTNT